MLMGLKEKAINGVLWSFSERFLAQIVSFIVSIVLARVLDPDHYGVIAIVLVFINLLNVFATSGFGNALIQKENADNIDFSTVFFFNIIFSTVLYLILFSFAPLISFYFNIDALTPILRVMGIRIIIASINSVQRAYVSRGLLFKRFFFATLGGTIVSALVGIILAYKGFGVWALVAQYLSNTFIDTVVLWFTVKWRPQLTFSLERLKSLFSYGWKLLLASLLSSIYTEISDFMIGKVYGSEDLSYFNRGKKFPQLFITQVNSALDTVLFPTMTKHQNQIEKLKNDVRYSIRFGSFCLFPLLLGLVATADNVILLLLTEKWVDSVIYVQLFCLTYLAVPISMPNIQAIKAMGRSDVYLKLDLIKQICCIIVLLVCIRFGVIAVAIANVIFGLLGILINVFPNKKLLNYSFFELLSDITPNLLLSTVMCIGVYLIGRAFNANLVIVLIIQVIAGILIYLGLAWLFKFKVIFEVKNIISSALFKSHR